MTLDSSQASEQTKTAKDLVPDFVDRRQGRSTVDRRKTRNPVFEARARRVGMALDRRRSRSGVTALFGARMNTASAADADSAPLATEPGRSLRQTFLERCASWWRPLLGGWTSANRSDPTDKQASSSN